MGRDVPDLAFEALRTEVEARMRALHIRVNVDVLTEAFSSLKINEEKVARRLRRRGKKGNPFIDESDDENGDVEMT